MARVIIGVFILLLGVPFVLRGSIYRSRPDHPLTQKRIQKNLRLGWEADMKKFGRKIRRFGVLLVLSGGALAAFGAMSD